MLVDISLRYPEAETRAIDTLGCKENLKDMSHCVSHNFSSIINNSNADA